MTTRKLGGETVKARMERHVSFGDTEIETYKVEDETPRMSPEEKTKQWLETGSLTVGRGEGGIKLDIDETSTSC